MTLRPLCLFALACVGSGCITARSFGVGQVPYALAAGQLAGSVSGGPAAMVGHNDTASGLSGPLFEGSLRYAFSDHLALDLHGSAAGLDPGLVITVGSGPWRLGFQPLLGVGYQRSQLSDGKVDQHLRLAAGLRVQVSTPEGSFVAVSYQHNGLPGSYGVLPVFLPIQEQDANLIAGTTFRFRDLRLTPELAVSQSWRGFELDNYVLLYAGITVSIATAAAGRE